jgi:hypothetical protein
MSRTRRLTWEDRPNLQAGDQLFYSAGLNDHHCEAYVTVTQAGTTGVMVDVDQIVTQGSESTIKVGANICAGYGELEITIPTKQ